jgi:tetratricopeptide (TPR) repeat protein
VWYDKSIQLCEGVLKKGRHVWAMQSLAVCHFEKGKTFTALGQHEDALREWDQTLPNDKPQDRDETRMYRATTLARLGRHTEAVQEATELASKINPREDAAFEAACVCTLAAEAAEKDVSLPSPERKKRAADYLQKAFEWLGKAREKGYFKSAKSRARLNEAEELRLLRPRPEFKSLIDAIERK